MHIPPTSATSLDQRVLMWQLCWMSAQTRSMSASMEATSRFSDDRCWRKSGPCEMAARSMPSSEHQASQRAMLRGNCGVGSARCDIQQQVLEVRRSAGCAASSTAPLSAWLSPGEPRQDPQWR